MADRSDSRTLLHFAGGVVAGIAGSLLYDALKPGRRFSPKLLRESREHPDLPATVILPGPLETIWSGCQCGFAA